MVHLIIVSQCTSISSRRLIRQQVNTSTYPTHKTSESAERKFIFIRIFKEIISRTRGDGMEFVEPSKSEIQRKFADKNSPSKTNNDKSARTKIPGATSIYRHNDDGADAVKLPATIPQGKQFYLVPHLVSTKKSFSLKNKEPINSELKNLLVAAVGEDLQTRVNVLTEDKLQLAHALLNSAHDITTHAEQIEYLANQSEVWRSNFLASSLMVEELARWKASLMQKNKLLLESNKHMLETMSQLRSMQVGVLRNLKFLAQLKTLRLPSNNVLDLTNECLNISDQLVLHSGIGIPANLELGELDASTQAEKLAVEAIQQSNQTLVSSDAALKAVVDQAFPQVKTSVETQTPDDNDFTH